MHKEKVPENRNWRLEKGGSGCALGLPANVSTLLKPLKKHLPDCEDGIRREQPRQPQIGKKLYCEARGCPKAAEQAQLTEQESKSDRVIFGDYEKLKGHTDRIGAVG